MAEQRVKVYVARPTDRANLRLQWVDPTTGRTRTRSAGTADEAAADRARADLEYELNHGLAPGRAARATWDEFVRDYLGERLASRRARTREQAGHVFKEFQDVSRVKYLADVDARHVSKYAAHLRGRGRAESTIAGYLAYLRAGLRWAADQEMIAKAPKVPAVKLPRRLRITTLADDDFGRLLAAAWPGDDWRLLLRTAWHTGLRRNELITLSWSADDDDCPHLDLDARRVWFGAGSQKAAREDFVPVHDEVAGLLAPRRRPAGRVFDLFPGKGYNLHTAGKEVSKRFRAAADAAGLPGVSLHDIRRTFGSRYARVVPAQLLQRLMRHADIKTTLKYYADLDGALADAVNRL